MITSAKYLFFVATIVFALSATCFSSALQAFSYLPADNTLPAYVLSSEESDLMAGAPGRIERYRKGDASVRITDGSGAPVANTKVHVEMLRHDFLFGCNLEPGNFHDDNYRAAFAKLFNFASVFFAWAYYEPTQGITEKKAAGAMIAWARDHQIKVKGHPLVWDISVPDWALQDPDKFWGTQCTRIKRETQQFCGQVDYWTVMDEPTPDPLKDNFLRRFMKANGPATVTKNSLDCASQNCGAKLLVNDYITDSNYNSILQDVRRKGGKFDIVGLQSHMHNWVWPLDKVWNTCENFTSLGLPLHFTEVTIVSGPLKTDQDWTNYHPGWDTTPEGEKAQSDYAAAFYTVLFSHPSVESITWWDLSDRGAWLGAPSGLLRKDMTPKPAYERLLKLIRGEWWTETVVTTDADGIASWRGFYGEYRLSATAGNKKSETIVYLEKNGNNSFKLQMSGPWPGWYYWLIAGAVVIALALILLQLKRKRKPGPR